MSELKNKSDQNIWAAEKLIKENLHAPSVHCSYYSCFQLLKHYLFEFYDFDQETYDIKKNQYTFGGTHEFVINYHLLELKKIEEIRVLKNELKQLKKFRNESDYDDIKIGVERSKKAYKYAENVLKILKKTYN